MTVPGNARTHRGVKVNDITYMENALTEEERESGAFVKLDVKNFTGPISNSTLIVGGNPELAFGKITSFLGEEETKVEMSNTHWKLTYAKAKPYEVLYED